MTYVFRGFFPWFSIIFLRFYTGSRIIKEESLLVKGCCINTLHSEIFYRISREGTPPPPQPVTGFSTLFEWVQVQVRWGRCGVASYNLDFWLFSITPPSSRTRLLHAMSQGGILWTWPDPRWRRWCERNCSQIAENSAKSSQDTEEKHNHWKTFIGGIIAKIAEFFNTRKMRKFGLGKGGKFRRDLATVITLYENLLSRWETEQSFLSYFLSYPRLFRYEQWTAADSEVDNNPPD